MSRKKVEEGSLEEAGEVFGSAAGAPEVSLPRFGMGGEGEIRSKKRKQRVDVGSKLYGERSKLQGGLHLVASLALHFSKELAPHPGLVEDGGLTAWTLDVESGTDPGTWLACTG